MNGNTLLLSGYRSVEGPRLVWQANLQERKPPLLPWYSFPNPYTKLVSVPGDRAANKLQVLLPINRLLYRVPEQQVAGADGKPESQLPELNKRGLVIM
ncbi:hypothetical protein EVAR_71587_1 [Eumeta japonica]|uniref:Uncharacterized protein n=1 Tax=Eumeta variegata TaxID=151549 RepID=A0A4C1TN97_EUMVA|nr:hypothetical protein EVAR_71587_1 [Eumeta japonica]